MTHPPRLAGAMTPFPYSVGADDLIEDAIRLMEAHDIRHVPVTEGERVVGVITDRDVKAAQRVLPELHGFPVRTAFVEEPYVVEMDTRLDAVLAQMAERQIGSAIVVRHGKLAGIFTYVDACRAFAQHLRAHYRFDDGPGAAA